jgi:hypothetical protein
VTTSRPIVLLVSATLLLDALFYAALTPLLPQYARDLHLSKTSAGILSGAFGLAAMVLPLLLIPLARHHGVGFASVNFVWAGGQLAGAVAGGALAARTSDGVAYIALAAMCGGTLAAAARARALP